MSVLVEAIVEYNDNGYLIYSNNYIGAYVRGKFREEALSKFGKEISQYVKWESGKIVPQNEHFQIKIVQEKKSDLQICDADSDVIFDEEKLPLCLEEYLKLKSLAVKSATDFKTLYDSIPDKEQTSIRARKTFYGEIPRTAQEMYTHTNNVTNYYIGEIGVEIENISEIIKNRIYALKCVEDIPNYLNSQVFDGSYGEQWTLRKVLRRFIWHDRIHAKAMHRMATVIWGTEKIKNPFFFTL